MGSMLVLHQQVEAQAGQNPVHGLLFALLLNGLKIS